MQKSKLRLIAFVLIVVVLFIFICLKNQDSGGHKGKDNSMIEMQTNGDNSFVLHDNYPMTDEIGRKIKYNADNSDVQGYIEFTITSKSNVGTNYELYLIQDNLEKSLHPNYLKVYLTDENNKALPGFDDLSVPTFYNLRVSSLNPAARRIYYGYLDAGESRSFILRTWIGDAYTVSSVSKQFGAKLYVEVD
ncbi:MAG: hypothetical protein IJ193_06055 [Bacilli bacterium]|nr:hypothetical protein [Bacilli bacterium]